MCYCSQRAMPVIHTHTHTHTHTHSQTHTTPPVPGCSDSAKIQDLLTKENICLLSQEEKIAWPFLFKFLQFRKENLTEIDSGSTTTMTQICQGWDQKRARDINIQNFVLLDDASHMPLLRDALLLPAMGPSRQSLVLLIWFSFYSEFQK